MKLPRPLLEGVLVRRYQRFLADVRLSDGSLVTAHTPNTGSMKQCAVPGHRVLLSRSDNPVRKLAYTLELIEVGGYWVDTHTQRSNRVVEEALKSGVIAELQGFEVRREVRFGASRMDFLLENESEKVLLEVKNVTLCCRPGVACFPDAVTLRGQRHLQELHTSLEQGYRAVIFFLVQRGEATAFTPADEIDPVYGRLLREVCAAGVEALAYRTQVTTCDNRIGGKLPVVL
ncbi:sugar fermentation stimulation protein A [Geoalkalibacter ferrihydriticus]|uniref:Sugar fermentation stimulation protein homolog n=2 Tax=Geoalkalibacter ferrihydriticus TaxID=392333 RepID=A0A0C2HKS7_9BACT|nr:DNA/RNA nuclease SfsA [Geoalkalibacter ferrihydriticus]KIH75615.1 transcriptional regulator [Geoalkalibacter ferrihydriticus DSM 17813]SDL28965.1 sugar fermentation stimulation protein A [Geoalkalibacter ferrihydriticus]